MSKQKIKTKGYKSLRQMAVDLSDLVRPPERITVSEAAAKYRYVNSPGSFVGWWDNRIAPYMVEPMNILGSRDHSHMAFVGPAQSGKTDSIVINGLVYSIKVNPMDLMVVNPTNSLARDFSIRRVSRLHRHSKAIGECVLESRNSDNLMDKQYVNGMMLSLAWPSESQAAGRPIPRVIITDYDRIPDDIDGDGSAFDLFDKRTTTFGSFAMCAAESSPSKSITDLKWIRKSAHEAPPAPGIMSLYNRGDRRLWYWPCTHCGEYFEGKHQHLYYHGEDEGMTNADRAATTMMMCPHCGSLIHPDERSEMQQWASWVPEGMTIDKNGRLQGRRPEGRFASFWLKGVAAAFTTWPNLVLSYLNAMDDYDRTKSEEALKKYWNTDQGEPYIPQKDRDTRLPEDLKDKAVPHAKKRVPEDVRFLVATVDVQKYMFKVMITGIRPGSPFDQVVVDYFEIVKSNRKDEVGDVLPIKPASYLEDWDRLVTDVMQLEYELDDDTGRMMPVKITGCDSGGKEGVTAMAYNFYRKLREEGLSDRFWLLKGDHVKNMPRTMVSLPDAQKKDNKSAARGDIPVLRINSNTVKDMLDAKMDVTEAGRGCYVIPDWLDDDFFCEMCAEVKINGKWVAKGRNEAFDLSYYVIGLCISPKIINIETFDWDNPPGWAAEWSYNTLIREADSEKRFAHTANSGYDFSKYAENLA